VIRLVTSLFNKCKGTVPTTMTAIDTVTINGTLGCPMTSGFVVDLGLDGVVGEVG
jgi:hypothetical protein